MNSGRRIIRQEDNRKKKKRKKNQATDSNAPRIIVTAIVTIAVIIMIVVGYEQLRPIRMLTVGNEKVYLSDLMFDVFSAEQTYGSMDEFYKSMNGVSVWDAEIGEGMTGSDAARNEVEETTTKREVVYQKAVQEGYTLTDEEKETIEKDVDEARKALTVKQKLIGGLSAKKIRAIKEKDAIAKRYEEDKREASPIDQATLTADISKEDLRQYDVQYYSVSFQTGETDEEGNPVPMSDEEKAELKKELEAVYATAETAEDFTKLLPEEEPEPTPSAEATEEAEDGEEEATPAPTATPSPVTYSGDTNFIESEDTFLSEEVRTKVKAMENDAISELLEDENGYYFVKMINNNSTERYDTEVENAITAEKDRLFAEEYDKMTDEIEVDTNIEEWDKLDFGNITL